MNFRNRSGKRCKLKGLYGTEAPYNFDAYVKRRVMPNRKNRFRAKAKRKGYPARFKARVTGRLISRKRASLKFTVRVGGCVAKRRFNKAIHSPGG